MKTLTQILQTGLPDANASSFMKRYNKDMDGLLWEARENIVRIGFSNDSLAARKQTFVKVRADYDKVMIIAYESIPQLSLVTQMDSNHMMKKLLLLPLFRDRSKEEAVRYKSTPEKKFFSALRMARLQDRFIGYDFCDINGSNVKTVSFTDAILGKSMADDHLVSYDRNDYNNQRYAFANGGKIVARVRSNSSDSAYPMIISSVPIAGNVQCSGVYATWQDLSTNHDCEKTNYAGVSFFRPVKNLKMNSLGKREIKNETKLCQHVIAALKAYNGLRTQTHLVLDPIAEFKEDALEYNEKLRSKTLVETIQDGKKLLVPVNEVNRNLLLFDYIKQNPEQAYFAR